MLPDSAKSSAPERKEKKIEKERKRKSKEGIDGLLYLECFPKYHE